MMLEQLPVFTNVETEAPGDLAKNTKLVIREWVSFRHSLPVQESWPT